MIYFNQNIATPLFKMKKQIMRSSFIQYVYISYIDHGSSGVVNKVQLKGRTDFEAMKMIKIGEDLK